MKKEVKDQIIESISAQLKEYPNFYIADISGLNAEQTSKLRRECFNAGVKLSVVKNTLLAIVIKREGNEDMQQLLQVLEGNSALMLTNVPNAPGKIIKKFKKEGWSTPEVKGAYVQECLYLGAESLNELAAIKTKEELIGDVVTLLLSPIRRVVAALENKENAVAPAAEEAAPAPETPAEAPAEAPAETPAEAPAETPAEAPAAEAPAAEEQPQA